MPLLDRTEAVAEFFSQFDSTQWLASHIKWFLAYYENSDLLYEVVWRRPDNLYKSWVAEAVALNRCAPPELLELVWRKYVSCKHDIASLLANNFNTPPQVLTEIAEWLINSDYWTYAAGTLCILISHDKIPPGTIAAVVDYALRRTADMRDVLCAAARNRRTPPDTLVKLFKVSDTAIRKCLASNPGTPPEILRRLSSDSSHIIRMLVAGNPSTPAEVLQILYQKALKYKNKLHKENVFMSLAQNPSCPESVLLALVMCGGDIAQVAMATLREIGYCVQLIESQFLS